MHRFPTETQAAVYGAVLHYLKAAAAANSTDGRIVMQKMKEIPVNDFMTKNAKLREDGRLMRDMLLLEVKKPQDMKDEWDLVEVLGVMPAEKIIRPLEEGECPFVKAAN
jgi:branched-chain amino acid transport system substrate-binding protein